MSEPDHLSRHWLGLHWTAWMPLMAAHPLALAQLPFEPGFYRLRQVDRKTELVWVGWTDAVRELAERLSRQVHLPVPPYDDPGSPALLLWSLRREQRVAFEISGSPFEGEESDRLSLLAILRQAPSG